MEKLHVNEKKAARYRNEEIILDSKSNLDIGPFQLLNILIDTVL